MTDPEALADRLDRIEAIAEDRPGEALDELEAVIAELDAAVTEPLDRAHALVRNEDFPGAARALGESATLLGRTATLALTVREQVRRRR